MKNARKLVIGALAGVMMLVAAVPAMAKPAPNPWPGELLRLRTFDPLAPSEMQPLGGEAHFTSRGGKLRLYACDIARDGFSVRAYASYNSQRQNLVRDWNGANNGCSSRQVWAAADRQVVVNVCLHSRWDFNCSGWSPVLGR